MSRPSILVVGATGNTGKSVVRKLLELLEPGHKTYRIVGLTRSLDSAASKQLAALPNVDMLEKDWTTIDAEWLRSQGVVRAYVAPHSLPNQFVEESALYTALLHADVEYVVKVSTTVAFIGPTSPVYYGRSHWAIEQLLSQPEFESMQWTSLRPNLFTATLLPPAIHWIKSYRSTGKQELLAIVPAADTAVAMIAPEDIGDVGAHLLALEDPTPHNHAKYVLSGPEGVTGKQIVDAVERLAGVKVQEVDFKSTTWLYDLVKQGYYTEKLLPSFLAGLKHIWQGSCSLASMPTSQQVLEIAHPRRTLEDAIKAMLEE